MNRAECKDGPRPCPKLSCRYHLVGQKLLPSTAQGANAILNHIDKHEDQILVDLTKAEHTCTLDVADTGPTRLEEVGEILGLTRERVRQIEATALRKIRKAAKANLPGLIPEYRRDDFSTCTECDRDLPTCEFSTPTAFVRRVRGVCEDCKEQAENARREAKRRERRRNRWVSKSI